MTPPPKTDPAPRAVAVVQARMGSSRFPGKMLATLAGEPLLWHSITRLRRCRSLDIVAVATSRASRDDPLAAFAGQLGVQVVRGSEADVLSRFGLAAQALDADIIVRINGDAPLIDPQIIDDSVAALIADDADYVMPPKGVPCFHDGVDVMSRRALERLNAQASDDPLAREHVTAYFKTHPEFVRIATVPVEDALRVAGPRLSIDYPTDLVFFEALYQSFDAVAGELDLRDVAASYREAAAQGIAVPG